MHGKAVRRIALIAYLALVLFATLAPLTGDIYQTVSRLDKLAHVGLFAGVSFLAVLNTAYHWKTALWAIVATSLLAGLIELIQGALPYRTGDWLDLWAGVLGACLGAAIAVAVHQVSWPFGGRADQ